MNTLELIRSRLETSFSPNHLVVIDDSEAHRGHAGYGGGGRHFKIEIKANCFEGLSRLEIHRKIYQALEDLMPERIHAIKISAN